MAWTEHRCPMREQGDGAVSEQKCELRRRGHGKPENEG
jgi:hypothetical protein